MLNAFRAEISTFDFFSRLVRSIATCLSSQLMLDGLLQDAGNEGEVFLYPGYPRFEEITDFQIPAEFWKFWCKSDGDGVSAKIKLSVREGFGWGARLGRFQS